MKIEATIKILEKANELIESIGANLQWTLEGLRKSIATESLKQRERRFLGILCSEKFAFTQSLSKRLRGIEN